MDGVQLSQGYSHYKETVYLRRQFTSDNLLIATSKKESTGSEVSEETAINCTNAPFTCLLF